jgi:predicted PurR-regulated permease PerM
MYIAVPKIVENINGIASFFLDGNVDIVQIVTDIKNKIDNQYVQDVANYLLKTSESIQGQLNSILIYLSGCMMHSITNFGSGTITLATSFIINIYMLIEKEDILARARRFVYAYFQNESAYRILMSFKDGNKIFKSFLNGKLLDSSIVAAICIVAFSLTGVPYAPLLGTFIGAMNMIPYFGPIIGSVPVVLVSFFVNPPKALTAILVIIGIQQLDANFLDPRIVGRNVGVSPFWIIAAVSVGGKLFGVAGMVFAVPVTVLMKTILEQRIELRLIAKGMGEYQKENLRTPKEIKKNKKKT